MEVLLTRWAEPVRAQCTSRPGTSSVVRVGESCPAAGDGDPVPRGYGARGRPSNGIDRTTVVRGRPPPVPDAPRHIRVRRTPVLLERGEDLEVTGVEHARILGGPPVPYVDRSTFPDGVTPPGEETPSRVTIVGAPHPGVQHTRVTRACPPPGATGGGQCASGAFRAGVRVGGRTSRQVRDDPQA